MNNLALNRLEWLPFAVSLLAFGMISCKSLRSDPGSKVKAACQGSQPYTEISAGGYTTRIHLPDSYSPEKKYPTVVSLHGWTVGVSRHSRYLSFGDYSAEKDFITITPSNTATYATGWNFNRPVSGVNRLLKELKEVRGDRECLGSSFDGRTMDLSRLVLAGHSAGARGAYMYAAGKAEYPPAGLVILAGDGSGPDLTGASKAYDVASKPMFLIHIHGTLDFTVGYGGGKRTFESYFKNNKCTGRTETSPSSRYELVNGTGCSKSTAFYSMKNAGHNINLKRAGVMEPIVDQMLKDLNAWNEGRPEPESKPESKPERKPERKPETEPETESETEPETEAHSGPSCG